MTVPDELDDEEVVVGGGVHSQVYCATRTAMGFPKPVVLERAEMAGGIYRRYSAVPFWLNSVNMGSVSSTRQGPTRRRSLTPRDDLNYFPNCRDQVAGECDTEYPDSMLVARVVKRNLARYARLYTGCTVTVNSVTGAKPEFTVNGREYRCRRLVDARGLAFSMRGVPAGPGIMTADDFLQGKLPNSFADDTPRRIAILGDGDTACIVAESLLGQAPGGGMRRVNLAEIGWYGPRLPVSKQAFLTGKQARYVGLCRHLPQDGIAGGMITPRALRVQASSTGEGARVGGQNYDLAVYCTGYQPAFTPDDFTVTPSVVNSGEGLWRQQGSYFIVGTAAGIPYRAEEEVNGYTRFPANVAAILRLAPETARLAASLPA